MKFARNVFSDIWNIEIGGARDHQLDPLISNIAGTGPWRM